jgi:hypothetical protein
MRRVIALAASAVILLITFDAYRSPTMEFTLLAAYTLCR